MARRFRQVEPKPFNCLTTTAQSPNNTKITWRELVWVGWGGQTVETWLELGENLSLIKFKPTQSNSSQVGGQTIPNSIEVVKLGWVGSTVWPGLHPGIPHYFSWSRAHGLNVTERDAGPILRPVYTCDFRCDFGAILMRFCAQSLPQPTPHGFIVA